MPPFWLKIIPSPHPPLILVITTPELPPLQLSRMPHSLHNHGLPRRPSQGFVTRSSRKKVIHGGVTREIRKNGKSHFFHTVTQSLSVDIFAPGRFNAKHILSDDRVCLCCFCGLLCSDCFNMCQTSNVA